MTTPTRVCLCGCGTVVNNKWAKGHSARGEGGYAGQAPVTPIPGPDDAWWDTADPGGAQDAGELDPDPPAGEADPGSAAPAGAGAGPGREAGPVLADPPPAHGRKQWRRDTPKGPGRKPSRVTAGIRNDIDAKISFALEIPGRVWQARDPLCGGTFVEQRPEISAALTEIVCQSPDLIAWFAGGGGQFMLWMNLAAACWPVATVTMAHHVYHTAEIADGAEPDADPARYAA